MYHGSSGTVNLGRGRRVCSSIAKYGIRPGELWTYQQAVEGCCEMSSSRVLRRASSTRALVLFACCWSFRRFIDSAPRSLNGVNNGAVQRNDLNLGEEGMTNASFSSLDILAFVLFSLSSWSEECEAGAGEGSCKPLDNGASWAATSGDRRGISISPSKSERSLSLR